MTKRPSYTGAVEWIARNDEPTARYEQLIDLISVVLVADLFGIEAAKVAADVERYRNKEGLYA